MMNSDSKARTDGEAVCEQCGQFGVLEIAGCRLCADCVTRAGCACAGDDSRGD